MTLPYVQVYLILTLLHIFEIYGNTLKLLPSIGDSKTVALKSNNAFFCMGRPVDDGDLQWLVVKPNNNEELISSKVARVFAHWHNVSSNEGIILYLNNVEASDAGLYICRNQTSSETISFELIVHEPIRFLGMSDSVTAVENQTIVIRCEATGEPRPVVSWLGPNNQQLKSDKYVMGGDGLIIHNLTRQDAGRYQCRAFQQGISTFQSVVIQLHVNYAPEWEENDVRSILYKSSASTAKLSCKADGKPPPKYTWYLEDDVVSEDAEFLSVNIKGNYYCRVSNEAGEIQRHFSVKEGRLPGRPIKVMPHNVTSHSLKVNFSAPLAADSHQPHEAINCYRIEVFSQKGNHRIHLNVSDASTFNVTNLKPNTVYIVRLRAENEVGLGDSLDVQVTTKASAACHRALFILVLLSILLSLRVEIL